MIRYIDKIYEKYTLMEYNYAIQKKRSKIGFYKKIIHYTLLKYYSFSILLIALLLKLRGNNFTSDIHENLYVSMTTFPARLSSINFVLDSLLRQTVRPEKIFLFLAKNEFDYRLQKKICKRLEKYKKWGVDCCFIDYNYKSHNKYFEAFKLYPDKLIITVDDDLYYPSNMIERLLDMHKKNTNAICANITRTIQFEAGRFANYSSWPVSIGNNISGAMNDRLVALGYGGILYPPSFRPIQLFNANDIMEYAPKADDLWLKAIELVYGYKIITSNFFAHPITIPNTQLYALKKSNCGVDNGNDIQWINLSKRYKLYEYFNSKKTFG